jgi:hypothetical protein
MLLDKIDLVSLGKIKDLDTEAEGTIIYLLLAIIHIGIAMPQGYTFFL